MSDTNESMIERQHSMQPTKKVAPMQTSFAKYIPETARRHFMLKCVEERLQFKSIPLSIEQYNELVDLFGVAQ
jgi:hypothetical protein